MSSIRRDLVPQLLSSLWLLLPTTMTAIHPTLIVHPSPIFIRFQPITPDHILSYPKTFLSVTFYSASTMNILVSPRLTESIHSALYMLISLSGHPFWSVYDSSRAVETTSKVSAESATRAGERKGEVGSSGKENNGRHQTKCESWEYGACARPADVKIRADKLIHYYRMLAKYLLKTLCEHEDISKSSRR